VQTLSLRIVSVILGFNLVFCTYVFLIDCLGDRRNDMCDSGKRSGYLRGSLLVEVYKLLLGVLML